ncbi:MAG: aldo/keto reductase [Negativicutes bacterium]|nr:aldo/keto reductase [Negativicutes bacterium]
MEKRRLGRTGLEVTAVSLGALPVQRCSIEEAGKVLNAALDAGINFIDTARAYTDSEEKIGRHLAARRSEFYLATKSMARTKAAMARDIDQSLICLKTDYIDLYQVHNIKNKAENDAVFGEGGALEALKEARQAGKIRHIGITGHSIPQLIAALKTNEFSTVQVPFNCVETEALAELIPLAAAMDIGRIIMKPLAGGMLRQPDLALRWILEHDISTAIPGMDTVEQIFRNIEPAKRRKPLSAEERAALKQEAEEIGREFCRRCGYCLPCAAGIDIPTTFVFYHQYLHYGLKDVIPRRYKAFPAKASDCTGCGACERRCPYNLAIRERMKRIAKDLG